MSTKASHNSNSDDSLLIAVMGSTGTGKSSFIRTISGDQTVRVGSNLHSETLDIQRVEFTERNSGRKVTLVDTPGFDDSDISDTDILKMITNFLLNEYDTNRKLNGLVYFQRISDPRFGGQNKRNLRMFKKLCGTDTYKNTVVLTTFWDKVNEEEGNERETQMHNNFFHELVVGGATFMRHGPEYPATGQRVIEHIFDLSPVNAQIAKEMREEGMKFEDTAAGSMQREEVDALIAAHKAEVARIRTEMNQLKDTNEARIRELEEDKEEMQKQLRVWLKEKAKITIGLDGDSEKAKIERKEKLQERQNRSWGRGLSGFVASAVSWLGGTERN